MHGLNLAIPFDYIEGAVHLSSVSLALDATHDWSLGRFGSGGMSVETNVIDTALWLIPERYKPEMAKYDELIILRGRHWALACDELVKSVRIPADKVSWASSDNPRAWLWGTYMEERCAILDIPKLMEQFDQAF
jgi:purine-binding chemotaxis protein CheW